MLLAQHRGFVECDLDSDILSLAERDLLLMFASQVLHMNSDITGDENFRAATRGLKEKVAVISARTRASAWEVLPGLATTQVTPVYGFQFLCMMHPHCGLYEKCRHIPLAMQSSVWRS